jgi:hypothetical protein
MTKIYRRPTEADCIARGATVHRVTVAEFCMLKIVSAAVVAPAKLGFRTLVQALLRLRDPFGFNACLGGETFGNIAGKTWPAATKMAGEGMPKPRGRDEKTDTPRKPGAAIGDSIAPFQPIQGSHPDAIARRHLKGWELVDAEPSAFSLSEK